VTVPLITVKPVPWPDKSRYPEQWFRKRSRRSTYRHKSFIE